MADLKEFEQKAEELRVLGMKISVGQDTVYELTGMRIAGEIFIPPAKVSLPVRLDLLFRKV